MIALLQRINDYVWGVPALLMILVSGVYLSVRSRFVQLRCLPAAFRLFLHRLRKRSSEEGGITPFQSLCTALAATVGTGTIAGVAGAICIGVPVRCFGCCLARSWAWSSNLQR